MNNEERAVRLACLIEKVKSDLQEYEVDLESLKKDIDASSSVKPWRPAKKGYYYYIGSTGSITLTINCEDRGDHYLFKANNCYEASELAQKALDKQNAVYEVRDIILECNGDWVADYQNPRQSKCSLGYDISKMNLIFCFHYLERRQTQLPPIKPEKLVDVRGKITQKQINLIFDLEH